MAEQPGRGKPDDTGKPDVTPPPRRRGRPIRMSQLVVSAALVSMSPVSKVER